MVDASGRGSRAPKWLEEMGYALPEEQVTESGRCYPSLLPASGPAERRKGRYQRPFSHP